MSHPTKEKFEADQGAHSTQQLERSIMSTTNADDIFSPDNLRIRQDFTAQSSVKKLLTTVPVRKPEKNWFVRVNTDPTYCIEVAAIHLKEEGEFYIVTPELAQELALEVTRTALFTAINRQGTLFLWPVRLPDSDGKSNRWNEAALEAAETAKKNWVRVMANMNLGAYEIHEASGDLKDPLWPDYSFQEILKVAFKGRIIDDQTHEVLRRLRGEM
jgi:hypothetical protein